jgi:hypothetical protein
MLAEFRRLERPVRRPLSSRGCSVDNGSLRPMAADDRVRVCSTSIARWSSAETAAMSAAFAVRGVPIPVCRVNTGPTAVGTPSRRCPCPNPYQPTGRLRLLSGPTQPLSRGSTRFPKATFILYAGFIAIMMVPTDRVQLASGARHVRVNYARPGK